MTEKSTRTFIAIFAMMMLVATPFVATHQATAATASKTGVMIALYTYPGSTWDVVAQAKSAHPSVPIVAIINPDNGPGSSRDPNYVSGIQELHAAGVTVLGYDATGYASNSASSVKSVMNTWKSLYTIDGIFFDEMANWSGPESYYSGLTSYAKSLGYTMTVGNPGTDTLPSYIGTVDNLMIYENPGLPPISALQGWHTGYDKSNFSMIAFGVNSVSTSFLSSASNYVGYIDLTNDVLDNPYDSVPSYFGTLVADLDTGSSGTNPTVPSVPTGLTGTVPSATQINLSWTAPSNNGGSAITGYKIDRSSDAGLTWRTIANTAGTGTTYSNTGLAASTAYTYRVSATNAVGTGSASNAISATTLAGTGTGTGTTVTITVKTMGLSGNTITGLWTTLKTGGTTIKSGYTTKTYSVTAGTKYTVTLANYQNYVFDHWSNGSTSSSRTITPTANITLVAYYQQ
ncbi:MAG TPA: spherulation-specific family 4 protein [Candidatus Nitrosotalea sp.]|nr:spherulation-specific family 4 protein [Candidatus Nitrosotalea sp.]